MRHKIITFMLFIISHSAIADEFDGFYAGGTVSYADSNFEFEQRDSSSETILDLGLEGAKAGLFLGYGKRWANWYSGIDIAYFKSWANSEFDIVRNVGASTGSVDILNIDQGITISTRGGYVLNNSLLAYGRLGVNFSRFETNCGYRSPTSVDCSDLRIERTTHTRTGLLAGIGIEYKFSQNFHIIGEYQTYHLFDSIEFAESGSIFFDDVIEIRPEYSGFTLGLSYQF